MINRSALLLRYKAPGVQWINEADPMPSDTTLTLEGVNNDLTLWPKLTMKRFDECFDVECHSMIIDTLDGPIEDDQT